MSLSLFARAQLSTREIDRSWVLLFSLLCLSSRTVDPLSSGSIVDKQCQRQDSTVEQMKSESRSFLSLSDFAFVLFRSSTRRSPERTRPQLTDVRKRLKLERAAVQTSRFSFHRSMDRISFLSIVSCRCEWPTNSLDSTFLR